MRASRNAAAVRCEKKVGCFVRAKFSIGLHRSIETGRDQMLKLRGG